MIMILGLYKRIHIKKKKKLIIFHAWISQTGNFLFDDVGVFFFFFFEKIVILIRILEHENNIWSFLNRLIINYIIKVLLQNYSSSMRL